MAKYFCIFPIHIVEDCKNFPQCNVIFIALVNIRKAGRIHRNKPSFFFFFLLDCFTPKKLGQDILSRKIVYPESRLFYMHVISPVLLEFTSLLVLRSYEHVKCITNMRDNIIKFISNVRGLIHISIYKMKYVIS